METTILYYCSGEPMYKYLGFWNRVERVKGFRDCFAGTFRTGWGCRGYLPLLKRFCQCWKFCEQLTTISVIFVWFFFRIGNFHTPLPLPPPPPPQVTKGFRYIVQYVVTPKNRMTCRRRGVQKKKKKIDNT